MQLNYVIDSTSEAVLPTDLCHLNDDNDDVWQTLLQLEQDVVRRRQRYRQCHSYTMGNKKRACHFTFVHIFAIC